MDEWISKKTCGCYKKKQKTSKHIQEQEANIIFMKVVDVRAVTACLYTCSCLCLPFPVHIRVYENSSRRLMVWSALIQPFTSPWQPGLSHKVSRSVMTAVVVLSLSELMGPKWNKAFDFQRHTHTAARRGRTTQLNSAVKWWAGLGCSKK